jgi:hypothetical protein
MTGHTKNSHILIRQKQKNNDDEYHHPKEKIQQLDLFKSFFKNKEILEVFGGQGNLTAYYTQYGSVTSMTKEKFGSSFDYIYQMRADKKKWDVIDIDSYGYPDHFFPIVFDLMRDKSLLIFTFPIVGVNCLNGITEQHFINFWRSDRPTIGDITGVLTDMALRYWFLLSLKDVKKIKRIWRIAFECKKQKATEFCNVKNR